MRCRTGTVDPAAHRQAGFTLVELLVAMGIFGVVLAIFGAGIASMSGTAVDVQRTLDATNEARKSFTLLDTQVRYASGVAVPSATSLVLRTDAVPPGQTPTCTQWQVNGSGLLRTRTWTAGAGPGTRWRNVTFGVSNAAGRPPFVLLPVADGFTKQRVQVRIDVGANARGGESELLSTFVARNSGRADGEVADIGACTGVL